MSQDMNERYYPYRNAALAFALSVMDSGDEESARIEDAHEAGWRISFGRSPSPVALRTDDMGRRMSGWALEASLDSPAEMELREHDFTFDGLDAVTAFGDGEGHGLWLCSLDVDAIHPDGTEEEGRFHAVGAELL
jgi:hypothetical protein